MNKFLLKLAGVSIIGITVFAASGHVVHAGIFDINLNLLDFVNFMLASLANMLLTVVGWLLALSGAFLNLSISLTLQIKEFVESAPGIVTTWKAIRDISGLVFIFFLIYAAFLMILGVTSKSYAGVLKSIVIAGILINFSWFIVGVGIDFSNIISVQLYNAIAPANSLNAASFSANQQNRSTLGDGGISDIFMQSLRITSIYDLSRMSGSQLAQTGSQTTTFADSAKIIMTAVMGIIIELVAALSFLGAAIAFVARFVILLFLLAFSPIWFLGFIAPEIKNYTKQWEDTFFAMLLFMPLYLLLMYFAMTIISTTPLFSWDNASFIAGQTAAGNQAWYAGLLSLAVNAIIILFFINLPLVASMTVASKAGGERSKKLFSGIAKKFGRQQVTGRATNIAGTQTLGRFASSIDKKLANTPVGNQLWARDLRASTLGSVAKAKMGEGRSYEDRAKDLKDVSKKETEIVTVRELKRLLDENQSVHSAVPHKDIENLYDKLGEKQVLEMGKSYLKNPNLIRNLNKKTYGAIDKSDDISAEDKHDIISARTEALISQIKETSPDKELIRRIMKQMDDSELAEVVNKDKAIVDHDNFVEHITQSNIKKMNEDGLLEKADLEKLGKKIYNWPSTAPSGTFRGHHRALSYIEKNKPDFNI